MQDASSVFGYNVVDSAGNNIGSVDNVWVDDATNELEFVGVKTGWLFGKTHVIPCADAQFSDNTITVPYAQDQIKDAPSFGADDELSPDDEQGIYSYYGLDRSTAPSPSGLPMGGTTDTMGTDTIGTDTMATDSTDTSGYTSDAATTDTTNYGTGAVDNQSVRLHEEELQVGKREVQAGEVRLRKVVSTQHQEVPVELRREEVEIERVPVSDASGIDDSTAFTEQEIEVPVMREEAVVGKQVRTTGEVRLNKNVQTETETVGGDVRSEDVDVDNGVDTTGAGTAYASTSSDRTGYTTDSTDQGL
jgi:uncharacterized protein (TIGR02271 family)